MPLLAIRVSQGANHYSVTLYTSHEQLKLHFSEDYHCHWRHRILWFCVRGLQWIVTSLPGYSTVDRARPCQRDFEIADTQALERAPESPLDGRSNFAFEACFASELARWFNSAVLMSELYGVSAASASTASSSTESVKANCGVAIHHGLLPSVLWLSATIDQVNLMESAVVEFLGRRLLQIQRAASRNPRSLDFSALEMFVSSRMDPFGKVVAQAFGEIIASIQKDRGLMLTLVGIAKEEEDAENSKQTHGRKTNKNSKHNKSNNKKNTKDDE
jgi:hypothetical protein